MWSARRKTNDMYNEKTIKNMYNVYNVYREV